MSFYVYQNNKPAVMEDSKYKRWHSNKFETKREAEIYAFLWAYPVTLHEAITYAPTMELNIEYDYSSWEPRTFLMKITKEEGDKK